MMQSVREADPLNISILGLDRAGGQQAEEAAVVSIGTGRTFRGTQRGDSAGIIYLILKWSCQVPDPRAHRIQLIYPPTLLPLAPPGTQMQLKHVKEEQEQLLTRQVYALW